MNAEQLITEHLDLWTSTVKVKSTQGRGSSSKRELYGIKKLRELILGLGLSGLLSDSKGKFPKEVGDLLSDARKDYSEKQSRKLKDFQIGSPIIDEFKIPSNWKWVRVADLCDLQTGATPSRQHPEFFGGDIPWLVSGDINKETIEDCEGRISEAGLSASNCKILPAGTVLIALNGQGKTRATVALMNISAACNQSLVGMIPFDPKILEPRFLQLALKYRYFEIREITGQHQRRGLNMGLVAQLSIPFPPIATQNGIVAKVDELMSLCDQLEQQTESSLDAHNLLVDTLLSTLTDAHDADELSDNWARLANHFDTLITTDYAVEQLKQTILQLAVQGKLVPQDPNDEPASELLTRIAAEKERLAKENRIKKSKSIADTTEIEATFPLPDGWAWTKFGVLAQFINGDRGKNYPNKEEYVEDGIPWINTGHIERDGTLSVNAMNYITTQKFDSLRGGKIETDDLVYCLRGATFGKTAFVRPYEQGAIASSLMIIRPYTTELNEYIYTYLISPFGRSQIFKFDNGSAQPNLSANSVMQFTFPCPPLSEQKNIVSKVNELMSLCTQLSDRLHLEQTSLVDLTNAITEQKY